MRERTRRRRWRFGRLVRLTGGVGLISVAAVVSPGIAAATERVQDGGFEASVCDAAQCTNTFWEEGVTTAFSQTPGPICRAGTGAGNTACSAGGSAAFGGTTWLRLGAGYKASAAFDGGVLSWVEQTVSVPTAPATLSFRLRIIDVAGPTGQFTVKVGDAEVFGATDATPGFTAFAPVRIDLSAFAGTAPILKLEGISSQLQVGALDSFDVDDVSLTTVHPRCAKLRAKLKKAKRKKKKRKIRRELRRLGC